MVADNRANLVKKRSQIAKQAAAEGKSASDAAKAAAEVHATYVHKTQLKLAYYNPRMGGGLKPADSEP